MFSLEIPVRSRSGGDGPNLGFAYGDELAELLAPSKFARFLIVFSLAHFLLQSASFEQFFEAAQSRRNWLSVVNAHPQRHTSPLFFGWPGDQPGTVTRFDLGYSTNIFGPKQPDEPGILRVLL